MPERSRTLREVARQYQAILNVTGMFTPEPPPCPDGHDRQEWEKYWHQVHSATVRSALSRGAVKFEVI